MSAQAKTQLQLQLQPLPQALASAEPTGPVGQDGRRVWPHRRSWRRLAVLAALTSLSSLASLTALTACSTAGAGGAALSDDHYTATHNGWTRTRGGAGGRILRVTNLQPSGPGSLLAAIEAQGPRTVVFEVGGVIDMAGAPINIRQPYLTIAGQTAPSPGISIVKAETTVATHDVVIQHLRFRPGEFGRPKQSGNDQDGMSTLGGAHDVVVDHCSFSWATDENLSASGPRFGGATPDAWRRNTSHRITYSHNLIYQGLSHSVHEKGEHSKGSLIHDNVSGVLLYRNMYASNRERNALFKGGSQGAMVNNLISNPGRRAVHYNLLANEWAGQPHQLGRLSLLGNVLQHGPDTEPGTAFFTLRGQADVALHLDDNLATDAHGRPVPMVDNQSQGRARVQAVTTPELPDGLERWPAHQVARWLPARVGARPWDRDTLDQALLADVAAGRGRIIDSETASPLGYPRHAPTRRAFQPEDWRLDDMSPRAGWADIVRLTRPPG